MANETNKRFSNRVSDNPNRRELRIVSQTPDCIIADVYRADTVKNQEYGTPIDADVLNDWDTKVNNVISLVGEVDCSKANRVGVPTVKIIDKDGGKRFSFENLKGQKGDTVFLFDGEEKSRISFDIIGDALVITTE